MRVDNISSINFGILDRSSIKKRPYGEYYNGKYRDNKIEIYDAYKFNQRLVYASDKYSNFIRLKLVHFEDSIRKVFRSRRG